MRLRAHPIGPVAGVFIQKRQASLCAQEHAIFRYGVGRAYVGANAAILALFEQGNGLRLPDLRERRIYPIAAELNITS